MELLGKDDTHDGYVCTSTLIVELFPVFEVSSFEQIKVSVSNVSPLNLHMARSFLHVIRPVLLILSMYDDDSTPWCFRLFKTVTLTVHSPHCLVRILSHHSQICQVFSDFCSSSLCAYFSPHLSSSSPLMNQ